jgi:putative ABC transport system ATP-binding protein
MMTERPEGDPVLIATGVSRTYTTGPVPVQAVRNVDLAVHPGTLVVVRGRSGSGKTTLLNMLGGLDQPDEGTVLVEGRDLSQMDEQALAETRRFKIGFIFQAFGLVPILTAAENVEIPLRLASSDPSARRDRARRLLEMVGLGDRAEHRPDELSGGEQQRVAIARALANGPRVLIADEPTGQLDSRTGQRIIDLIHELVTDTRLAAVLATHDPAPLAVAHQVVELEDGRIKQRSTA